MDRLLCLAGSLVASLALADVAPPRPPRPPPPPTAACESNADCVMTTFAGCCGSCCPRTPYAISRTQLDQNQRRCAAVDCAAPNCAAVRCAAAPDISEFRAVCSAGQCVAQRVQAAVCRTDADCRVVQAPPPPGAACHSSPCGCCPTNQAVSADAVVPLQQPTRQQPPGAPPAEGKPNFGLTTGDTANRPRPQPACSPCPPPLPARAACVGGQCTLQPAVRPPPPPPG